MTTSILAQDAPAGKTALVHVVAFKYKADAPAEQTQKLEATFAALKGKISEITSFAGGTNVGKSDRAKGFQFCAVAKFKSQKDLDTYLAHPDHQALVKLIKESVEDVFVIDFWE